MHDDHRRGARRGRRLGRRPAGDPGTAAVLLYLRVTRPTTPTYVLPGTLTAGAIAIDLSEVADPPSGYAVVRSFALDVAYRARVRAVDAAGLQSAKRTVAFTLR